MGRFSLGQGNAQDAPPPYKDASPPLLVTETTTTTQVLTTTTTHTTHFFSLPLWKKRPLVASSSSPTNRDSVERRPTEDGRLRRERFSEKDLPPTPPEDPFVPDTPRPRNDSAHSYRDDSPVPSLSASISSRKSLASSQPTAILARASFGLGLPHALRDPSSSASSTTSDINTVAFLTPPEMDSRRRSIQTPRRAKSSTKLRAMSSLYEPGMELEGSHSEGAKGRIRGVSLGNTAILNSGYPDIKGKGKEVEEAAPSPMPKPALVRRASFWSRKKSTPADTALPAHVEQLYLQPSPPPTLPSVSPLSPFTFDDLHMTSSSSRTKHSRGLSRSHSERSNVMAQPSPMTEMAQPILRKPSRRPATADPSTRSPTTLLNSTPSQPPPLPPQPDSSTLSPGPSRRPRSQTNPPLLHRLSLNLFSSSNSPSALSQSPLHDSPISSPMDSPRASLHKPVVIPKPETEHESPEIYLNRLLQAVSKAEVAGILASSPDPFYAQALRAYIGHFAFAEDPLDIALRKLLMHVGLPRETQQIDRVMEAFASRYRECNPNLFTSEDHPYILAFSLIMLHTDAFNKSNKRKMTKADYIKNTKLPGIHAEVLDCFYDNIVVTPFIFIEDPLDVNGQRGILSDGTPTRSHSMGHPLSVSSSGSLLLSKSNKVDPYYLIANNLLGPLRVDVESYIPRENPYLFRGTAGRWDEQELQLAFAKASVIELGTEINIRSTGMLNLGPAGTVSPTPLSVYSDISVPSNEISTLRVTKVGVLHRKDDTLEGGKKSANRKWKSWSVILTGSQLLFFRDPAWAVGLLAQAQSPHSPETQFIYPQTAFKPDELMSVKDAIAVFDKSYVKHDHTLRLVMAEGRQFMLQAADDREMNEWISRINYASAFKTAGVRMRPLAMTGKDVHLTGVAAATSHLHDLQHAQTAAHRSRMWDSQTTPRELMDMMSEVPSPTKQRPIPRRRLTIASIDEVDLDVPTAPEVDGADQFKATFDQVKAALAAGKWADTDSPTFEDFSPSSSPSISRLPSRSHIIQTKIRDLDAKMSATQTQLDSDLRFVRNIGTLTPFQRSTRDRLVISVQNMAKRVMQGRLELAKLTCHRQVLASDLTAESQDWNQARKLALKAATETLQIRNSGDEPTDETEPEAGHRRSLASSHRPDSTADSFHSALDFNDEVASPRFLAANMRIDTTSSSPRSSAASANSLSFFDASSPDTSRVSLSAGPADSPQEASGSHEKFYTALESPEAAEEWDQTRCAQRVSLVRVPSDFRIRYQKRPLIHNLSFYNPIVIACIHPPCLYRGI
ncbi:unnamed protein product [Mycena citricolor]|uniref:Uncharacterized protein n=1 Tax=Mycena citricolor TaxID=2018698 RepID=A0AAD2Q5Z4_9AGAR|nr:unnamed protein product [Mycena citricolor]